MVFISKQLSRISSVCAQILYLGTISLLHFISAAAFIHSVIFAGLEIKLSSADTILDWIIYDKTFFLTVWRVWLWICSALLKRNAVLFYHGLIS